MELLHGDCLELMKTLPDKSVDLFVCDLPYGCLTGGAGKEKAKRKNTNLGLMRMENGVATGKNAETPGGLLGGCPWDIKIDLSAFWHEVKRLCKDDHTPVLMFCSTKFGFELYNSNPDWFRYDLVWNKMRGVSFLMANKMPMKSHEMIYVFSKKGANYYRTDVADETKKARKKSGKILTGNVYNPTTNRTIPIKEGVNDLPAGLRCALSVIDSDNNANKKGKHPTQKPDDLYEWLITRYSKEGDMVLDPTAGSFASVFAAQRLGRRAVGIEMDKDFYEKAVSSIPSSTPHSQ